MGLFKKKSREEKNEEVKLKKQIGILEGVSIVAGVIIGSGIFVSPVGVLKYTNSVGLSLVMWAATGVFSALGALVYAELGVTIPKSGGEYVYILECFGAIPAFLALWITFVVIGAAAVAANSLIFSEYILKTVPGLCEIPMEAQLILAYVGILTLAFINSYSVKSASWVSVISTFSKFTALLIIFGFGVASLSKGNVENFQDAFEGSYYHPGSLAAAFYQGFWSFSGWNYLNFLTAEVIDPEKNLPRIILLSLGAVTVIYLLVNVAYLAVLAPHTILSQVGGGNAVAVTFARACMGNFFYVMPVFVGASVFGSLNGEIMSMSRLGFAASEQGHMPRLLSTVHIRYLTPLPAVVALVILSLFFTLYRDIGYLIELAGLSFTIISDMAVLSLLYIRRYRPETNKTKFKLPIIVPILYLVINSGIGILTVYQSPKESLISLGLMAAALPVYLVFVAWNKPASVEAKILNLSRLAQKVFNSVPQEQLPNAAIVVDANGATSDVEGEKTEL